MGSHEQSIRLALRETQRFGKGEHCLWSAGYIKSAFPGIDASTVALAYLIGKGQLLQSTPFAKLFQ